MGISGIFREIGPGDRQSLIALSAAHHSTHSRPFCLAIDTSIWLFQIQASKGGSNPALRTFYYRLLRLLAHNIHPLFVFDGPNKPTFKRNKKVGGPGVRVASVPEFLAKQLLKEFGFPWHVAPGEAEAECAVLQREGVVDAVMSEDVDTLMFGSGVTLRNWTPESKGKVPTHVNVYRAEDTKSKSGLDREGMILVAMMSGGDYIVEGIPGCGPRVACDAARAGFGRDLCAIAKRKDGAGLVAWKERLQREINTNESKFFTRKNKLAIPEDFPNREVLGYYTNPCVSTPDKIERLRESLQWDQQIDYVALRNFTADAFDWRCISGAKKFVRNLAPALLARELRLKGGSRPRGDLSALTVEVQEQEEKSLVSTIHSKRSHASTDNSLEYRISFTPVDLVPIDLSIEDEDDASLPAGGGDDLLSEADNEWATLPASTQDDEDDENAPATKTRSPRLYDPTQPEKLWLMGEFLRMGCPLMVRKYEDGGGDPKALFKARREARAKTRGGASIHAGGKKLAGKGKKKVSNDMPSNPMLAYATVNKSSQVGIEKDDEEVEICARQPLSSLSPRTTTIRSNSPRKRTSTAAVIEKKDGESAAGGFRRVKSAWLTDDLRASQSVVKIPSSSPFEIPADNGDDDDPTPKPVRQTAAKAKPKANNTSKLTSQVKVLNPARPFAQFARKETTLKRSTEHKSPASTPVRRRLKRPSEDELCSAKSQRTIDSYFSPTPKKKPPRVDIVNLVTSSPLKVSEAPPLPPPLPHPPPLSLEGGFVRDPDFEGDMELPASVTKRRPRRRMQRARTDGIDDVCDSSEIEMDMMEGMDLASPSPVRRSTTLDITAAVSPSPWKEAAPVRRSPRISPPRSSFVSIARDKGKVKAKKQRIQLRESVEGAWKYVDADTLDLTGDYAGGIKVHGRGRIMSWRESGVELLDLTAD